MPDLRVPNRVWKDISETKETACNTLGSMEER